MAALGTWERAQNFFDRGVHARYSQWASGLYYSNRYQNN